MKTQQHGYGCGLYAVANLFEFEDFITHDRLLCSQNGVTNGQLSKYLLEDGHGFNIDCLYYNCLGGILPDEITQLHPNSSKEKIPILIQVKYSETSKNHLIGGILYHDGRLLVFDSLKTEPYWCTLSSLLHIYFEVFGIFDFTRIDTGDRIAFIDGEQLNESTL